VHIKDRNLLNTNRWRKPIWTK